MVLFNGIVQQVVEITGDVVLCKEPDEDHEVLFELPLTTVSNLNNSFSQ